MKGKKRITRKDETLIPRFNSHIEAREWFKKKYGEDFMMVGSEEIGEQTCYFYYLVTDRAEFEKGTRQLIAGVPIKSSYLNSHQPVQIMENGEVHIVH